jgi:hypothetical protein
MKVGCEVQSKTQEYGRIFWQKPGSKSTRQLFGACIQRALSEAEELRRCIWPISRSCLPLRWRADQSRARLESE